MNREIKFRGLRSEGKGWVYGYYSPVNVPILGNLGHCINEGGYRAIDIDHNSLGQYTGLKDKNGKEIYEGDILMYTGTNQCDLEVHYKNGAFWGKGIFTDCIMDMYLNADDFKEI